MRPDDTTFDSPYPFDSHEIAPAISHSELLRAARRIGQRLDAQNDDLEDDAAALRWRHALLRLSETFLDAAEERRDLSPILLGALHNALEQLLIHGEESDLMALEEWLSHEATSLENLGSTPERTEAATISHAGVYSGLERRLEAERRDLADRRNAERRTFSERRS